MDDPNRHRRQNQHDPPIHNTPTPRYSLQEPSQQQRQQLQQHQPHQHQHQPQQSVQQPQTPQQQQHLQHQQYQQSQSQPQHHQQQQRQSLAGTSAERLRPPPLNTGSAGASRTVGSTGYGGYYPESGAAAFPGSIAQNALPYQSDYGQDNRQQTQGFGPYTPGMIYGVQTPTVYDFSARQQATPTSIIPSDVTASYSPFEPSSGTATGPGLPPQSQATPSVASVYQGAQLPSFTGSLPSVAGMSQQQQQQQPGQGQGQGRGQQQRGQRQGPQQNHQDLAGPPSADVSMAESTEHVPMTNGMEERWDVYQARIRNVFQDIQNGSLEPASEELLDVSNWIVSNIVDLGLHMDNQERWGERLSIWTDFNNAWLALLQRQKDMLSSGQQLPRGQSVLSREAIDHMGREIVRLCDNVERHGLVDYEYGIWEETIMSAIIECADQFDTGEDSAVSAEGSGSHN